MNKKKKMNLHLITLKGYNIVCYHVGQVYPPVQASSDEEQYYIRLAWHVQMQGQLDIYSPIYPGQMCLTPPPKLETSSEQE